jgi:hypothetical protein
MTVINPPPLKVPPKLSEGGFLARLVETVRLLWFYFQSSTNETALSGTTASTQGGTATIAHGVDSTKIRSVFAVVLTASGVGVTQGDTGTGLQVSVSFDATNVTVTNHPTNSSNVLSKSFKVLVLTDK